MTTENNNTINISFKSFGEDKLRCHENFYFINNYTIIFNSDTVDTASIVEITSSYVKVILNLKNGVSNIELFDITPSAIMARQIQSLCDPKFT